MPSPRTATASGRVTAFYSRRSGRRKEVRRFTAVSEVGEFRNSWARRVNPSAEAEFLDFEEMEAEDASEPPPDPAAAVHQVPAAAPGAQAGVVELRLAPDPYRVGRGGERADRFATRRSEPCASPGATWRHALASGTWMAARRSMIVMTTLVS